MTKTCKLACQPAATTQASGDEINRDPIAEEGDNNLYAFGSNNPICNFDVEGLSVLPVIWEILKVYLRKIGNILDLADPPCLGGSMPADCTLTSDTTYKSPQGLPVRRTCRYECSYQGGEKFEAKMEKGPGEDCMSGSAFGFYIRIDI